MHRKAIVHIMNKARMKSEMFSSDIDAMEEVSEKYGIKNVIFYKGEPIEYVDLINKLEKLGIFVYNYSNKENLKEKIVNFSKEYEVVLISSTLELLVNMLNEIRQAINMPLSDHPDIFRNKFLQRELIQEHNPDLGIKFLKGEPEDLDIKDIEEKIEYPFIIKPIDGLQSSGVAKIQKREDFEKYISDYKDFHDRLKNRGIDNKELIVEEFIDGTLYSIDYYVNGNGESTISKPVKVRIGTDVDFPDYCNIARIASEKTESEFKGVRLKTFINSTIRACGVRNTYVHHEFKVNSKGELKTIELNGRIGGGRLELMKRAYGLNMYEMICNPDMKPGKIKENNIVVNVYATKRGMLRDFNRKFFEKLEKRESVYEIELIEGCVGKEVGLTKDGFVKLGAIKLANKDYPTLAKDFKYIKNKYSELLIIDEFHKDHKKNKNKEEKTGIVKMFKKYLKKDKKKKG